MTNPRFAPELTLKLAGQPAPAELRACVTTVSLQSSLQAADRVDLSLANEQLRWLDHPLLELDTELALSLGYAPDPLPQLFVGKIVGHGASFPSGGLPGLTVSAQDRRTSLQSGTKARWFAVPAGFANMPLPDVAVAQLVATENALVPIVDPAGAAISLVLGGAEVVAAIDSPGAMQRAIRKQEGESDFDFLSRLSAENGWELVIDHEGAMGGRKLRFLAPLGHLSPDVTLGWGRSLLDFSPRVTSVGQIISVTGYVWVARIKTQFQVTVGWDWDRAELSVDVRPALAPLRGGASEVVIKKPLTPASAPRELISRLIPKLNSRLTGSGTTVGDPRIKPGAVLKLEGLGVQFSGLYRVTSATHTLDSGGYRTAFEVRKEIWFGSIPLPDQGAVPIRLKSPVLA